LKGDLQDGQRLKVAENAYDDDRLQYCVTFHYGNGVKSTKTFTTKAELLDFQNQRQDYWVLGENSH